MTRSVTALLFALLLLSACGSSDRHQAESTPRLFTPGSQLRGIAPHAGTPATRTSIAYPVDPALKLRQMEYAHQERLAAIEAEKAKALKALELEKFRSAEALKKRTKEIEARSALELERAKKEYAALLAQKEKAIKALETNASLHHDQTQAAIARMQSQGRLQLARVTGSYRQAIATLEARQAQKRLWILLGALALLLIALFLFLRWRRESRRREMEEERRHQARMQAHRFEHEKVSKILEIIASEKTETPVKVELARLLGDQSADALPRLIDYRPDATESKGDTPPPSGPSGS